MVDKQKKRDDMASKASTKKAQAKVTDEHKGAKAGPEFSWYVSAKEEVSTYDIKISGEAVKGIWDTDKEYVTWRVPSALSPKFELHHHFVMGRIIKADEE